MMPQVSSIGMLIRAGFQAKVVTSMYTSASWVCSFGQCSKVHTIIVLGHAFSEWQIEALRSGILELAGQHAASHRRASDVACSLKYMLKLALLV